MDKKEYHRQYYLKNKEKLLKRSKEYHLKNREKLKPHKKTYYLKNREKILAQHREYRLKNKEKIREIQRQYKINNRDKIDAYQKRYQKQYLARDYVKERIRQHHAAIYARTKENALLYGFGDRDRIVLRRWKGLDRRE